MFHNYEYSRSKLASSVDGGDKDMRIEKIRTTKTPNNNKQTNKQTSGGENKEVLTYSL